MVFNKLLGPPPSPPPLSLSLSLKCMSQCNAIQCLNLHASCSHMCPPSILRLAYMATYEHMENYRKIWHFTQPSTSTFLLRVDYYWLEVGLGGRNPLVQYWGGHTLLPCLSEYEGVAILDCLVYVWLPRLVHSSSKLAAAQLTMMGSFGLNCYSGFFFINLFQGELWYWLSVFK